MTFASSLSVKGHKIILSMRWSTKWRDLNPQNKHHVIRVKISSLPEFPTVTLSIIQVTMSSDVISKNKRTRGAYHFPTLFNKGFQAVNVYLGYFAISSYGSINLINLCYSVWVYPSACGIYPGLQSHQRVEPYLVTEISPPLTSCHRVPCSYPYSRSGSCGRGGVLSAIGFSVRKHNRHNHTEVQAASLKRRERWRGVQIATQRA